MAIVIPSKNIYSIDIDPVIDNQIDKVEIDENKAKIVGNTRNIYSNSFNDVFVEEIGEQDKDADKFVYYTDSNPKGRKGTATVLYVNIEPTYITKTISIPELQHNKKILSAFGGVDNNGNANITTYITGSVEKGTINGTIDMSISSKSPNYSLIGYGIDVTQHTATETKYQSYDLPHDNQIYSISKNGQTQSGNRTLTASVTLNNQDNVLSSQFDKVLKNGEWYYECTLTCLAGLLVEKFAVSYNIDVVTNYNPLEDGMFVLNIPIQANSEENSYELYTPQTIDISVNGETIEIDLQEEAISIGNGNKTFSFDGNELIQTTNTPTQESKYQEVIDKWKDGKQVAKIACSMADYYDENNNLKISPSGKKVELRLLCSDVLFAGAAVGGTYHIGTFVPVGGGKLKEGDVFFVVDSANKKTQVSVTKQNEATQTITIQVLDAGSRVHWRKGTLYYTYTDATTDTPFVQIIVMPFVFREGDIVIPYTYTNQGDKPLSYNKDFTPKQFKVVGTKLSEKQGAMQELTLQEV